MPSATCSALLPGQIAQRQQLHWCSKINRSNNQIIGDHVGAVRGDRSPTDSTPTVAAGQIYMQTTPLTNDITYDIPLTGARRVRKDLTAKLVSFETCSALLFSSHGLLATVTSDWVGDDARTAVHDTVVREFAAPQLWQVRLSRGKVLTRWLVKRYSFCKVCRSLCTPSRSRRH